MSLMSTCLFAFLSRDWQLHSVRLWGWLWWHNEHSDTDFLPCWSTLSSLLGKGEEKDSNCGVVDHPPPPPPPAKGGEYTHQISPGVIEEGLCCHLLGCYTWERTLELFVPAPRTSLPTSDSERIPQRWIFFFLLSFVVNNVIAEGWVKYADTSKYCNHAQLHFMYSISQLRSLRLQL